MTRIDVRFVATPFLPEHQPALGVSSLAAVLTRAGIAADVRYLNLDYGRAIGWEMYGRISRAFAAELLVGEIVFARALWGDRAPPLDSYVALLREHWARSHGLTGPRTVELDAVVDELRELRASAGAWVVRWADAVLADGPRVIGLTTTFAQTNPSLALAKELRRRLPREELLILLGGANCESSMGRCLSDNFGFIDHVVSGEAEDVIVELVQGHLHRDGAAASTHKRYLVGPTIRDMDSLPLPDFDDYFDAARGTRWERYANLAAESSRGCWWGQKSHCTFCGLNGGTMAFRSKSPERFADEIEVLGRRYERTHIAVTDNILDMKYVKTLFPILARNGNERRLFYESKSNLRKDQLEMLAAGGLYGLQPGIESLSTPILKLMAKGTTRLQNLQLLKWCDEYAVDVTWNFLFGFPGEHPDEYRAMQELLPSLWHLPAPKGGGRIRLDRFSPYWRDPGSFGMGEVRPAAAYAFAFPGLSPADLRRLAYYFDFTYEGEDPEAYALPCLELVAEWCVAQEAEEKPRLEVERTADAIAVVDTRPCATATRAPISSDELRVLQAIDRTRAAGRVHEDLDGLSPACVEEILGRFRARRWTAEEGDQILSLVLDRGAHEAMIERRVRMRLEGFGLAPAVAQVAAR